jgi:hypothetical protein
MPVSHLEPATISVRWRKHFRHPFKERIRAFDALSSAVTAFRYPTSTGRLQLPPQAGELRNVIEEVERLLSDAKVYMYGPTTDQPVGRMK